MTQALWFVPYLVAAVVHVSSLALGEAPIAEPTKFMLMPLLIVALVATLRRRLQRADVLMLCALILCWVGDIFVSSADDSAFLIGLAGFFLAHVLYLVIFRLELVHDRIPRAAVALLLWWPGMLWLLHPYLGFFFVPLAVYGFVIALSTAAALATNRFIAVGAVAFLISDTVLAYALFAPQRAWWNADAIIMFFYALAQLLIVLGFLREQVPTVNAANVTE